MIDADGLSEALDEIFVIAKASYEDDDISNHFVVLSDILDILKRVGLE